MKTLLFVCTANMCRSPMAEALMRRKLEREGRSGEIQVGSAGVWTEDGLPATDKAIAEMAARGIDIRNHESRAIREDIIAGAALVMTMTRSHAEGLRVAFPVHAARVYMLTELAGPDDDIGDPVGRSQDEYAATARQLEELIDRSFPRVLQLIGAP